MAGFNLSLDWIYYSFHLLLSDPDAVGFPCGQGQILHPYLIHYKSAFAFSSILYPRGSSVFVSLDLLGVSTFPRPCRVYPVDTSVVSIFCWVLSLQRWVWLFTGFDDFLPSKLPTYACQPYLVIPSVSLFIDSLC
jgi:hypothetical protein